MHGNYDGRSRSRDHEEGRREEYEHREHSDRGGSHSGRGSGNDKGRGSFSRTP